ncbi:hypothetical protein BaRGS_00000350 [Batillaria attramentaria]|uniref:Uncharacterized protein n=1 Tax=Batillaria attramentaria TaxID=370345 RepID=A0ABD0M9N7_9CAEN
MDVANSVDDSLCMHVLSEKSRASFRSWNAGVREHPSDLRGSANVEPCPGGRKRNVKQIAGPSEPLVGKKDFIYMRKPGQAEKKGFSGNQRNK